MNANNTGNYDAHRFLWNPSALVGLSCNIHFAGTVIVYAWRIFIIQMVIATWKLTITQANGFFWQSYGRKWVNIHYCIVGLAIIDIILPFPFFGYSTPLQPSFSLGRVVLALTSYLFSLWLSRVGNFHYVIQGTWDNRNHKPFVEGNRCLGLCLWKEAIYKT